MNCSNCQSKLLKGHAKGLCKNCYALINSKNTRLANGKWSKYSPACKECHRNDIPHKSWGFCGTCCMRKTRAYKKAGHSSKQIASILKRTQSETSRRCELCGSDRIYSYSGTYLPVCYTHFQDWRKTVPCDGCGQPAGENAIETENDNILYWWHYSCWETACTREQMEQLKAIAQAL